MERARLVGLPELGLKIMIELCQFRRKLAVVQVFFFTELIFWPSAYNESEKTCFLCVCKDPIHTILHTVFHKYCSFEAAMPNDGSVNEP